MMNKKFLALAGVAALATVGGSFAYYSASQDFKNPFNTTNYSTQSTEKFNPSGDNNDWKPGVEVDKEVYATNTGDGDVWVRIKFDEKWKRGESIFGEYDSRSTNFNTNGITADDHQVKSGELDADKDGEVDKDNGSVVYKKFVEDLNNNWYFENGYYYYKGILKNGESTPKLLDSVTLCTDADMGKFNNNAYYIVLNEEPENIPQYDSNDTRWKPLPEGGLNPEDPDLKDKYVYTYKENRLDDQKQGYANADYELNITVEFLQTTEENEIITNAGWSEDALKEIPTQNTVVGE